MDNDATPRGMLTLYRQNLEPFTAQQRDQFMVMPASERMELLFLMILNTNQGVQFVHSLIDPSVKTGRMPDPEDVH